jgi:hypothetical protein
MSLLSESVRPRRHSLAWALAAVAFIAVDLAAMRPALPMDFGVFHPLFVRRIPTFPNLGLVVMILVLEIGFFRVISRRGPERAFWLGFEVGGWAYVLTCLVFARTTWLLTRSLFEGYALGRQIGRPFEMERFVLFAFSVHLLVSLAIGLFIGILARSAWRRWGHLAAAARMTSMAGRSLDA